LALPVVVEWGEVRAKMVEVHWGVGEALVWGEGGPHP